jgi:hypothetical protein
LVISAFQLGLRRWHFYQLHLVLSFDFWGLKNMQKVSKILKNWGKIRIIGRNIEAADHMISQK